MLGLILSTKPVLVGLHLGFAILGIDFTLWLLGELVAGNFGHIRAKFASIAALVCYVCSWIIGGFYYVKFYGPLVKPIILHGSAPWAHEIAMEVKEHLFLMIIPLAATSIILALLSREEVQNYKLTNSAKILAGLTAAIGFSIGLMGFIISSAARWA